MTDDPTFRETASVGLLAAAFATATAYGSVTLVGGETFVDGLVAGASVVAVVATTLAFAPAGRTA